MKKIILSCVAMMAAFFSVSNVSAQGVKIHKVGGEVIDIPASELDFIEAYDAAESANAFEGVWKMKKLVTDKAAMDATWGGMATYGDAFPAFNADDQLTIGNGQISPSLQSTLKNFFTGEATYEVMPGTYGLHTGVGAVAELTILKVTGVNRNFDAASTSESNVAYIGVRTIEDEDAEEAGQMLLDVYLIDYEATSFATELKEFGMYGPDMDGNPYMAYVTGMYINFVMEKVGEVTPAPAKKFYEKTWTMSKLVTDKAAMDATWGGMATYGDAFPAFNAQDQLTFENGKVIPNLQSTLKNFFTGEATYEEMPGTYSLHTGVGAVAELTILKVTGVNRNFDAASTSESNVAYIGVRTIEDEDAEEAGQMLLDVYLIDYEATSFATELKEFGMYGPDMDGNPYMAYVTGMYINFIMK